METLEFVNEIAKLRDSATFLRLNEYRNEALEVASYNIVFKISYKNLLTRSIAKLTDISTSTDLEAQAKQELLESFKKSVNKTETVEIEDIDDAYTRYFDECNNYIKGVKLHTATNTLHLYGTFVSKVIHQKGIYLPTNKKALTIEKDKLRRQLPISKYRQFKITPDNVTSIAVEKLTLLAPEETELL